MNQIYSLLGYFVTFFSKFFYFLEKKYFISRIKKLGKNVYFGKNFQFAGPLFIGNNVHIGSNCVFQSTHGTIVIGNNVMFGPGVNIHGGDHIFRFDKDDKRVEIKKEFDQDGKVTIEDDVWIGANSIILKKVIIGKGSIIGAGTIISFNVPPYSIVYGSKPLVIKSIKDE